MNEIEKAIETLKYVSDLDTKHHLNINSYDLLTAVEALREKAERENPKPLTIDELREMDGEPVWIEDKQDGGQWGLVDLNHKTPVWYEPPVQAMVLKDGNFYILREYEAYGENLQAYRTKPEGSEEE